MEMTNKEIHLLASLSRNRRLYAECKGADLDALQKLGLLQWFDARSSTTPFKEDPRPLFILLGISGRIDFFWVETVENWRELVGPEVRARVDAIYEIEGGVNNGPSTASRANWQTTSGPRSLDASAALCSHESGDYPRVACDEKNRLHHATAAQGHCHPRGPAAVHALSTLSSTFRRKCTW
jgi:hypothetical protein